MKEGELHIRANTWNGAYKGCSYRASHQDASRITSEENRQLLCHTLYGIQDGLSNCLQYSVKKIGDKASLSSFSCIFRELIQLVATRHVLALEKND